LLDSSVFRTALTKRAKVRITTELPAHPIAMSHNAPQLCLVAHLSNKALNKTIPDSPPAKPYNLPKATKHN